MSLAELLSTFTTNIRRLPDITSFRERVIKGNNTLDTPANSACAAILKIVSEHTDVRLVGWAFTIEWATEPLKGHLQNVYVKCYHRVSAGATPTGTFTVFDYHLVTHCFYKTPTTFQYWYANHWPQFRRLPAGGALCVEFGNVSGQTIAAKKFNALVFYRPMKTSEGERDVP